MTDRLNDMERIVKLNKLIDSKFSVYDNNDNFSANMSLYIEVFNLEKKIARYYLDNFVENRKNFLVFKNLISYINAINMTTNDNERIDRLNKLVAEYCS